MHSGPLASFVFRPVRVLREGLLWEPPISRPARRRPYTINPGTTLCCSLFLACTGNNNRREGQRSTGSIGASTTKASIVAACRLQAMEVGELSRALVRGKGSFPHGDAITDLPVRATEVRCGSLSTAHLSSSGLWTYTMRWDTTFRARSAHVPRAERQTAVHRIRDVSVCGPALGSAPER